MTDIYTISMLLLSLLYFHPDYMNTTWISFKMSDPPHVAITIANSILIVTCILGNCFVCVVLLRNRDMRYIKQFYNNEITLQQKQEAIMMSRSMNKLGFRKTSIKPPSQISPPPPAPHSNKPSFFR